MKECEGYPPPCGVQLKPGGHYCYCPVCLDNFNNTCNRYRAMKQSIYDKPYKEQLQAINKFRAGL